MGKDRTKKDQRAKILVTPRLSTGHKSHTSEYCWKQQTTTGSRGNCHCLKQHGYRLAADPKRVSNKTQFIIVRRRPSSRMATNYMRSKSGQQTPARMHTTGTPLLILYYFTTTLHYPPPNNLRQQKSVRPTRQGRQLLIAIKLMILNS